MNEARKVGISELMSDGIRGGMGENTAATKTILSAAFCFFTLQQSNGGIMPPLYMILYSKLAFSKQNKPDM